MGLPIYFEKALAVTPFSKLAPGGVLRVYALSFREAPQLEAELAGEIDAREVAGATSEFLHDDVALQLESKWDLWQWDGEWALRPSRLTVECYGPKFDSERGEHIRVDAGTELLYLPHARSDQLRPVQSNIRSLLHLASDLEGALPVERRLLWSEEDEDFVSRLQGMLA